MTGGPGFLDAVPSRSGDSEFPHSIGGRLRDLSVVSVIGRSMSWLDRHAFVASRNWRIKVAKPFRRLIEELRAERRERIEAHTRALIQEYELLKALRQDLRVSQEQLAELMGIRQASVSKIENQDDIRLSTLRKYIEALGGELEIRVHFPDRDVSLDLFPSQPR